MLVIDYVRARTNGSLYRLMKPIIVKLQLASPGEVYKLRFVNVSTDLLFIFFRR